LLASIFFSNEGRKEEKAQQKIRFQDGEMHPLFSLLAKGITVARVVLLPPNHLYDETVFAFLLLPSPLSWNFRCHF